MTTPDTTTPASPPKLTPAERNALQMSILILGEKCEEEAKAATDLKQEDIARDWLHEKKSIETELPGLIDNLEAASKAQCDQFLTGLGLFFKRLRGAAGTARGIGARDIAITWDNDLEELKASLPPKLGEQKSLDLSPRQTPPEPTADEDQPHASKRRGRGKAKGKGDGDTPVLSLDQQRLKAAVEKDLQAAAGEGETPTHPGDDEPIDG